MVARVESRNERRAPGWVNLVARVSSRLNTLAAILAAVLLVLMTGLILVEIGLRFFSRSTFMTDVLVAYGLAAITFLAMAWALEKGSMIRVSVLTRRMPGWMRPWAEGFALVSSLAAFGILLVYAWQILARDFMRGTTTQHMLPIPLWIPEGIFLIGLFLLFLQFFARLLRLLTVGQDEEATLVL